jgi:hypothetical protein
MPSEVPVMCWFTSGTAEDPFVSYRGTSTRFEEYWVKDANVGGYVETEGQLGPRASLQIGRWLVSDEFC